MTSGRIVGRFAPSPTGRLHLGNLRSALLGWLDVRSKGGRFLVRLEDLDPDRSKPEHVAGIWEDLRFLGLDWDPEVLVQSERAHVYRAAVEQLRAKALVYDCTCSRAEVARAASAPHVGEDGPVYPGTCRAGAVPKPGRQPSVRFKVPAGVVAFDDELRGATSQDVAKEVGDFVVQRSDGVASYQLAVVVDDAASQVTRVVRGDDLLLSTPRQLLLQRALGLPTPTYAHVPLLLQPDGRRLAKREGSLTAAGLRARGVSSEALVGALAKWSGLSDGTPCTAASLVAPFDWHRVRATPTVVGDDELERLVSKGHAGP